MLKQFIPFQSIKYFISCDKIRNPRNTERNFDFRKEKKKKRKPPTVTTYDLTNSTSFFSTDGNQNGEEVLQYRLKST